MPKKLKLYNKCNILEIHGAHYIFVNIFFIFQTDSTKHRKYII